MSRRWIAAALALSVVLTGQAQVVPPGFDVTTVASGFTQPVAIALADDGRLFVAEKRGMVWVVERR